MRGGGGSRARVPFYRSFRGLVFELRSVGRRWKQSHASQKRGEHTTLISIETAYTRVMGAKNIVDFKVETCDALKTNHC